jgi:transcription elongation factor Elf1
MSPFIKITSKYCPNCNNESLSILTDGHKNNPTFIKYICKNCKTEYSINWLNIKNPRPIYTNYKILKTLMNI